MNNWGEFAIPTLENWESKILKDLKTNSLESIYWNSSIGEINPAINSVKEINQINPTSQLKINSEFDLSNENINEQILFALKCGIDSIIFKGSPSSSSLNGVMHEIIENHILLSNEKTTNNYKEWSNWLNSNDKKIEGTFRYDPLYKFISQGVWNESKTEDFKNWQLFYNSSDHESLKVIYINGSIYANALANPIQEVAYIGAHLNEYFEKIENSKKEHKIILKVAIGTEYFIEIAKLRALRTLVQSIALHRNISIKISIETVEKSTSISPTNKELNLLRSTTCSMASIIGGSDSISINKDLINAANYKKIFRHYANIPIVLKEESNISKVNDPSRGSYSIENLTSIIKNNSWELFKQIEENGGWINYLEKQIPQKQCKKNAALFISKLINKDSVIVGFNKYNLNNDLLKPNPIEQTNSFTTLKLEMLL